MSGLRQAAGPGSAFALLLAATNLLGYADRAAASVFAPNLKAAFALSDSQLGALQGGPFIISCVVATLLVGTRIGAEVPPGRLMAMCVLLWTAGAVGFALAPGYSALLAARVALGLGQAAFVPIALGVLAQRTAPVWGVQPVSLFTTGSASGRSVGVLIGGALLAVIGAGAMGLSGWRAACLVTIAPNLLLAAALWRARTEPAAGRGQLGLASALAHVWSNRTRVLPYFAATCALVMIVQASAAWAPSLIGRSFGLTPAGAGLTVGVIALIAAPIGHLGAGRFSASVLLVQRRLGAALALAAMASATAAAAMAMTTTTVAAMIWLGVLLASAGFGAASALIGLQAITPDGQRRGVNSLYMATVTVFGSAAGPWLTGLASDMMAATPAGLSRALALVVGGAAAVTLAMVLTCAQGWRQPFSSPDPL